MTFKNYSFYEHPRNGSTNKHNWGVMFELLINGTGMTCCGKNIVQLRETSNKYISTFYVNDIPSWDFNRSDYWCPACCEVLVIKMFYDHPEWIENVET